MTTNTTSSSSHHLIINLIINSLQAISKTLVYLIRSISTISLSTLSFTTITLPKTVFTILHWSGFISVEINFQKLLILFFLLTIISSWTYKLKVLNRYSALPKTSQLNKAIDSQLALQDLNPDSILQSHQLFSNHNHFHNYLDEFLSAIRVFGFLEKPVFHELARHLQTRRLLAGDTLSLDEDKSFYIVIDGSVQVFARSTSTNRQTESNSNSSHQDPLYPNFDHPHSPSLAYDHEDNNGFQLLNVVESGGTLSSLFTILNLFTEDVKLRYEDEPHPLRPSPVIRSSSLNLHQTSHHPSSLPNHPSEFLNSKPSRSSTIISPSSRYLPHLSSSLASSPLDPDLTIIQPASSEEALIKEELEDDALDGEDGRSTKTSRHSTTSTTKDSRSPYASTIEPLLDDPPPCHSEPGYHSYLPSAPLHSSPKLQSLGIDSRSRHTTADSGSYPYSFHPNRRSAHTQQRSTAERVGAQPREATIARATTDTTLAVIPSEAFKRLTSKFPNAVAHILQVILTRLQRVTFLTSHQYLGLTKELLRTEKAFNELACYPLDPQFYQQGGMVRLRQRFLPQTKLADEPNPRGSHPVSSDYFGLDPNRSSFIPDQYHSTPAPPTRAPTLRHGRNTASIDMSSPLPIPIISTNNLHEDLELRQAVMTSIAKSIGLVQHQSPVSALRPDGSNLGSSNYVPLASPSDYAPDDSSPPSPEPSFRGASTKPRPTSYQRPGFRSGLGSLSYLKTMGPGPELRNDGTHENMSSRASSSSVNLDGEDHADEELPNEVEILFFHESSTLVKAGERNAGLYFVIDGFLDVFMPANPDEQRQQTNTHASVGTDAPQSVLKDKRAPKSREAKRRPMSTLNPTSFQKTDSKKTASKTTRSGRGPVKSTAAPPGHVDDPSRKAPIKLFSIKPGGIAGYLASISGFPSYVDIRAKTDVYVGFLPARALESIMDRRPIVLLTLAKRLISLLSPLMLHIDAALEWMAVDAGQIIYREGDTSDNLYIVIGGRLRSISEQDDGGIEILGEFGQGESIGELDCITNTTRRSTLHAIRDSELVRIPMTLFNAISIRHPAITIQVSRLIASRVRKELDASRSFSLKTQITSSLPSTGAHKHGHVSARDGGHPMGQLGKNNFNLKTVAIIPNTKDLPLAEFATRLKNALEQMNSRTEYLNQSAILSVLGRHAFSRLGKLKLTGWLAELEQKFRIVLYVADTAVNAPWTQTCIRQADYILLVCDGGSQPDLGEYERLLISMKTTARKELVLLHPDRNVPAGSTRPWLRNRPWIHAHHHVELAGATPLAANHLDEMLPVTALRHLKERVQIQISKYRRIRSQSQFAEPTQVTATDDFARLARRLCGKSIAVVLGGGGARGISHIGVIRALQEHGIPIDMIGGTSIGSFIGGLYARNSDLLSTLGRAKTFSGRMATVWRILTDITYPVVAYTTGHEFNRGIYKSFYDYHIEDFWLPFWANTTNITWSRMEVHTTGYAWRYIRASMSLAGLLPPLCDEGDMLVDGGYIDNLPVSVMLSMGADSIFAVDVGSIDDTSPRNFPESVSGWWLLISRLNPWSSNNDIPTMTDIQSRLTYVSSVKTLEEAKATPGVLYMRMPVTEYTTMDFGKFEEILKKGYHAANEMLKQWAETGSLPNGLERGTDRMNRLAGWVGNSADRQRLMIRRNSV